MISVVIPALNEEGHIGGCIRNVLAEGADREIIVADGGSSDGTVGRAGEFRGVRIVKAAGGRGRQMNLAAMAAKGNVLLFLHADTRLEEGWSRDVHEALSDDAVAGGAFAFRIDAVGLNFRLIEIWVRLRCLALRLPYGDQGIFVRRDVFDELGGYRDIPLMEDVDLVQRIKRVGRLTVLHRRAVTSARRWERRGWIRVSLMNQVIMTLYRLGVDPGRLAGLYYGER